MQTKNQISLTRKTLYGIMLLGIFLSAFGTGNLPSAYTGLSGSRVQAAQSSKNLDTLIVLDVASNFAMQEAINLITNNGGRIVHVFPLRVLIGSISANVDSDLIGRAGIKEIHRSALDPLQFSQYDQTTQVGIIVWNELISEGKANLPFTGESLPLIEGDSLYPPPPLHDPINIEASEVATADHTHTSDYFIGKVAIGIILPESSGDAENWTPERRNQVASEIMAGTNWWAAKESRSDLTFFYDVLKTLEIFFEPYFSSIYRGFARLSPCIRGV